MTFIANATDAASAAPSSASDGFDSGPLSWVIGEIRDTLGRSVAALQQAAALTNAEPAGAVDADAREALLRQAKAQLHQAHGALQIVDVDGVAILTETIEELYDRLAAGQQELTSALVTAIDHACSALTDYLEELLAGAAPQPVRLFPYYRSLLEARGAERIHPADLFFPNLAIRPQLPPPDTTAAAAAAPLDPVALRKRFEKGLLPFLKGPAGADATGASAAMRDVVAEIAQAQISQQARGFWWVMHGFADGVATGQIDNALYVKQLFARINLQIRRMGEGSAGITERLLRDALFFIARVDAPSPRLQQIRNAYRLDGQVPADFDIRRYGHVDGAALAAARARLTQAKNHWNRIGGGDFSVAGAFEAEMQALSDAGASLQTPPLAKLLRELNGIARAAASAEPGDRLGLEMATCLLFVEHALGQIGHLDARFPERADAMTARLLSVVAGEEVSGGTPWLEEISRQAQQRQTMVALTGELQSSLRQVEKTLEEYFAKPVEVAVLEPVVGMLHQVGGALAVLDQNDAARAVAHVQHCLQTMIDAGEAPHAGASQALFHQVARNIGALGFFIDTLQLAGEGRRQRFAFDEQTGLFQELPVERGQAVVVAVPAIAETAPAADSAPMPETAGIPAPPAAQSMAEAAAALANAPAAAIVPTAYEGVHDAAREVAREVAREAAHEAAHEAPHEDDSSIASPPAAAGSASHLLDAPTAVTRAPIDAAAEPLPTVEEDLIRHQQDALRVAEAMRSRPADAGLLTQLKQALQQVRRDASLIDHPEAGERAKAALTLLEQENFAGDAQSAAALLVMLNPTAVPPPVLPSSPAVPETDAEVDAELLEIFLTEAVEVLEAVRTTLPLAQVAPHDQEHLTTLRRAFHTLKGSGRMVGLMAFGEAAWSIEQVMNQRLSASTGADPALHALLGMAHADLSRWVDDLQRDGRSQQSPAPLIAAAQRLTDGLPLDLPEQTVDAELAMAEPVAADAAYVALSEPEEVHLSDEELLVFTQPAGESTSADLASFLTVRSDSSDQEWTDLQATDARAGDHEPITAESGRPEEFDSSAEIDFVDTLQPPTGPRADIIEFPTLQAPSPLRNDAVRQIGSLEIGVALHTIYLAETDELVRLLAHDFDEWRHEPERQVNISAVHAAHSLAGTSATVGFRPLQEIAHALEAALQQLARMPIRLLASERDTLDLTLERIRFMLQLFALGEMADHEPARVLALVALREAVTARGNMPAQVPEPEPEPELSDLLPDTDTAQDTKTEDEVDFLPAAQLPTQAPVITAAMAGAFGLSAGTAPESLPLSGVPIKDDLDSDLLPVFIEEATDMLPQIGQSLRGWQQSPGEQGAPQALLRLLHTIKGSARMAGAMRLGQHMHELESRIEQMMHLSRSSPAMFDDLLARHDQGLQMFDNLVAPQAGARTAEASGLIGERDARDARDSATEPVAGMHATEQIAAGAIALPAGETPAMSAPAGFDTDPDQQATFGADRLLSGGMADRRQAPRQSLEAVQTTVATIPLVRVRADVLDRLVNQAGEVSISRSRLENEVDAMRQSLAELTDNLSRLREQLREVEMQAESQIANQTSARSNAVDGQFDPLEFDRFTRLQELTRMMAESVSDVGSVQQNMARTLDSAAGDLGIQARLTRELQQDLMSVRMVQFASITERLFRVTRQASKEIDKRVNLDIRGSAVEIDRSVLEKMAGPFEHLLRNAIVHGIESRAGRQAAGKNEVGELLVEVRQEGNEVVIEFSDDGAGLDLERIRSKAIQTGLLAADAQIAESDLRDLILHAGFSTATAVTELAGRGVGMDVVRTEATSLGGRVAIVSETGKGARFTVHLPLTLAVTQVVLLTTGGKTYAVPSVLVEQVQQLKTQALAAAYHEGAVMWQSQRVPMAYLATLLGEAGVNAVAQQYSPLLILKSGSSRTAIHVDEILGNREVVVKNIGPQVARLTGIAGATVLGSGEIVLILNPVALAQQAQDLVRAPRAAEPSSPGAVAEPDGDGRTRTVAGLRTQSIVMVVDDSLTVRRVTQRLLSREGYQVVLAKDGVDALEQLQTITPDVMLVDIEMPRMDGFDLTRNLRDDPRTKHVPIIMITSRTASKHRNHAFELGVNEYLGKPYQEAQLLASVAGFIAKAAPAG